MIQRTPVAFALLLGFILPAQAIYLQQSPLYRFYGQDGGRHFYTASEIERDNAEHYYGMTPEGVAYYIYKDQDQPTAAKPVYRFYNTQTGAHFWTISEAEKDNILSHTDWPFDFSGVAFHAYSDDGVIHDNTAPVYRFYNVATQQHFFTISVAERDHILAHYPQFHDEGIAWYAYPIEQATPESTWQGYSTTDQTQVQFNYVGENIGAFRLTLENSQSELETQSLDPTGFEWREISANTCRETVNGLTFNCSSEPLTHFRFEAQLTSFDGPVNVLLLGTYNSPERWSINYSYTFSAHSFTRSGTIRAHIPE